MKENKYIGSAAFYKKTLMVVVPIMLPNLSWWGLPACLCMHTYMRPTLQLGQVQDNNYFSI